MTNLKQLLKDVAARSGWGPEMLARIEAAHAELEGFEAGQKFGAPARVGNQTFCPSVPESAVVAAAKQHYLAQKRHEQDIADFPAELERIRRREWDAIHGPLEQQKDNLTALRAVVRAALEDERIASSKLGEDMRAALDGQGPVLAGWVNPSINGYIRYSDCVARYRDKTPGVGWEPVFFAGPGVGRPDTAPQQRPANVPQDDPNDSALPQALYDTAREIAALAMQQEKLGLLQQITRLKRELDQQRVCAAGPATSEEIEAALEVRVGRVDPPTGEQAFATYINRLTWYSRGWRDSEARPSQWSEERQKEFDAVRELILKRAYQYRITHSLLPLQYVLDQVLAAEKHAGWAQDKEPYEHQSTPPDVKQVLRQMQEEVRKWTEIGGRFYANDQTVIDEFLRGYQPTPTQAPPERQPLTNKQLAAALCEIIPGDEDFAKFDFAEWRKGREDPELALDEARLVMCYCAEAWGVKLVAKPAQEGGAA